ncbi:glycerate kinase [Vibrio neonatus]|uniref:glycerate kinase n=1 Tax=Vibrio neonatus TaxID=278860 RepID=UPI0021C37D25|nr:glycerate kinase [Vibrio neonatus]
MKIVIAPDSFKESLSAKEVCQCIELGFKEVFPTAQYCHLPLADGGEGTVEVLIDALQGEVRHSWVSDPLGRQVCAKWALLEQGKTALIEVASASGLDLITPEERNPAVTSTYGTGEIIKEALDLGVSKILLGLGGSATNDAGAGIIHALGGKLLDAEGQLLPAGGLALSKVHTIDLSSVHARCKQVPIILACDVSNPLVGDKGASYVFAPQKGADSLLVESLDEAIFHFSTKSFNLTGIKHFNSSGFGAAGGVPMGLSLLFPMLTLKQGIEVVLDLLDADKILENADLVITGEGKMDNQTLSGKAPFGIANRAENKGIPVIGIAGSLGHEIDELYSSFNCIFGTIPSPQTLSQVLEKADENLIRSSRNIAALLKLGQQI